MDREGFRQFLQDRKLPADEIAQNIAVAEEFAGLFETPIAEDVRTFSARLIAEQRNTWENYIALVRYGRFTHNKGVTIAAIEPIDGSEALKNLREKLCQALGEEVRDRVFQGIALPPLGTPTTELPRAMAAAMERLEEAVDPETVEKLLSGSLRRLEDAWYMDEKQKYLESGSLDAYLDRSEREFLAQLEKLRDSGELFFTQEITDEVLDFVRSHPEISRGVRVGNVIYAAKIPHMTKEYLAETDEQMKRYYYCHCPWVKESLRTGDVSVSPTFCHCSAGFEKKRWEVIFGQSLQADVLETVLRGDPWCKFAIHLPAEAV